MVKKIASMILMAVAAVTIASCYDPLFGDYVCEGAGTCYSPETCCSLYDCYYYADGERFDCYGTDCYSAADDLNYYCGY